MKPWVKFGVSPFGIYRNLSSDPINGSATSGLQNYDDLYADVLKWVENGWVDYNIPQLYWEIGHKTADYEKEHAKMWFKELKGIGDTKENLAAAASRFFSVLVPAYGFVFAMSVSSFSSMGLNSDFG